MTQNMQRVIQALENVVCQSIHDERIIKTFFAPDYRQEVDGAELDYPGFVAHMATLKQATQSIMVKILAIAGEGNNVLTHHRVDVIKTNGESAVAEVFAHFTLKEGKIILCQELTRLLCGTGDDRKLGSVR